MIMEGVKERGSLVVVPYEEAHTLGTTLGITSAQKESKAQVNK